MKIKRLTIGELQTNCYLLISKNKIGIVDPGGDIDQILKEINQEKAKLKYIVNTHYHFDHTRLNRELKRETQATILIHEEEKGFINFPVDRFLKDGDEIRIGDSCLKVIHTPGHTQGSICLLGKDFILTGDTIFKEGHGRTDLPGGSEEELKSTLARLSGLLKPRMMVYPGHGEVFRITS